MRKIQRPEIQDEFNQKGISEILQKNGIKFEELESFSSQELKELFGNAYLEYVNLLRQYKKGEEIHTALERVKEKLGFVMDVFFDKNPHQEIGEHLRERQKESVIKMLDFLFHSANDTGYVHFPTSSGKTVMFSDLIRNILKQSPNKKIIITVPNKEALKRSKQEFEDLGIPTSLYYGEEKDLSKNIVIGTTQSLLSALAKNEMNKKTFDLMVCDEVHERYLGEKTSEFIQEFSCKKIGFTATPELRNKNVEQLFGEKIDEYLIDEAIKNKELPEVNSEIEFMGNASEFEKLKVQNGDFSQESLEEFDVTEIFPKVLEFLKDGALKGNQMAIFLPSVKMSKLLNEFLNVNGVKSGHIDGTTKNREEIQNNFENKDIQTICSCEALKSSWDSDIIDGVIILRPTLSPAVYMQMIGRALHGKEIDENGNKTPKEEIYVCDLVNDQRGIATRHITTKGIGKIIKLTTKGKETEIINLNESEYVGEILFFYNLDEIFTQEKLEEIYKEFANKSGKTYEDFLEILDSEEYEELEEINISVILKTNSNFGESYAGREKEFNFNIKTLQKILKMYKKYSVQENIIKSRLLFKRATKEQLQQLWKNGKIDKDFQTWKWKEYAEDWNEKNAKEKGLVLPTSIVGLIGKLGGDTKISMTKEYIICLFEGREYKQVKVLERATKEQLQELWSNGEIDKDFQYSKWKEYAEDWNEKNAKEKGLVLPLSRVGLIKRLGGDIKISTTKEYVICLFEGREYLPEKDVTKEELQELWSNGEIDKDFQYSKWKEYAEDWNEKNAKEKGLVLPLSRVGLIKRLGGDIKISTTKEYIICLFESMQWKAK